MTHKILQNETQFTRKWTTANRFSYKYQTTLQVEPTLYMPF